MTHSLETIIVDLLHSMTQDWGLQLAQPLSPQTRLVAELGFESVDFMQLIVNIEKTFAVKALPYAQLFMQNGAYVPELTPAQIAQFLAQQGVNPL